MTPEELTEFRGGIDARYASTSAQIEELDPAPIDEQSADYRSDAYAEAIFLRAFTAYEIDVERMFLHYVTGGASMQGRQANTYLSIRDESHARRLTKGGYKFLSWAKPSEIKTIAQTYIHNGWPLVDMMATKEQDLSDCERVRNRIAHNSLEAIQQFGIVQRNLLTTERIFDLTPGQFLRMRSTRLRKLHIKHYVDVLHGTLTALVDPLA